MTGTRQIQGDSVLNELQDHVFFETTSDNPVWHTEIQYLFSIKPLIALGNFPDLLNVNYLSLINHLHQNYKIFEGKKITIASTSALRIELSYILTSQKDIGPKALTIQQAITPF